MKLGKTWSSRHADVRLLDAIKAVFGVEFNYGRGMLFGSYCFEVLCATIHVEYRCSSPDNLLFSERFSKILASVAVLRGRSYLAIIEGREASCRLHRNSSRRCLY